MSVWIVHRFRYGDDGENFEKALGITSKREMGVPFPVRGETDNLLGVMGEAAIWKSEKKR
jgi:hypothetical protein